MIGHHPHYRRRRRRRLLDEHLLPYEACRGVILRQALLLIHFCLERCCDGSFIVFATITPSQVLILLTY